MALVAVLVAGCAESRFKNDPRAALVGPDYLDYIAQYPRDRDTQFYYPHFVVAGAQNLEEPSFGPSDPSLASLQALLITLPEVPPAVQKIEGKGWPELERKGMPFSAPGEK